MKDKTMEKLYRKKPVVISAIKWDGNNVKDVYEFINGPLKPQQGTALQKWYDYVSMMENKSWAFKTMESDGETQKADVGDFIIRGVKGECYPCKPDVFELTYETPLPEQPVSPLPTVEERDWDKLMIRFFEECAYNSNPREFSGVKLHAHGVFRWFKTAISALYEPKQEEAKKRYEKALKHFDKYGYNGIYGAFRMAAGISTPPESNLTDKT